MACDRTEDPEHSRLLLWYAARTLDPDETRALESHLAECSECRSEAGALRSLQKSLRRQSPLGPDHPDVASLLAFEAGELAEDQLGRQAIAEHLDRCPSCRKDFEALRDARAACPGEPPETAGARLGTVPQRDDLGAASGRGRRIPPAIRSKVTWAGIGIAAGLAAVAVWLPLTRDSRGPATGTGDEVRFVPTQRSPDDGGNVLSGAGPWSLDVELPFEAPDGDYMVRVRSEDPISAAALPVAVATSHEGRIRFRLPPLSQGRFVMLLEARVPAKGGPYAYTFRVVPGSTPEGGDRR